MSVQWTQESEYATELAKWEMRPTVTCPDSSKLPRFNAPFQEYPKALFKAARHDGGPRIRDTAIAHSADHEATLRSQGWSLTQEGAIAAVLAEDTTWATLAAERASVERRMSPQAQAEAAAYDDATPAHVPEIPATAIRPHGHVITTDFQIERAQLQREIAALQAQIVAQPTAPAPKTRAHRATKKTQETT